MLNKLQGIKARYEELTHTLSRPEAMADRAAQLSGDGEGK